MRLFRPSVWRLARASAAALAAAIAGRGATPGAPAPLPDPAIAGFQFPESEATLTRWITEATRADLARAAGAAARIQTHAWGLWTALTAETAQVADGQRLRVFETWPTLDELAELPAFGDAAGFTPAPDTAAPRRTLAPLKIRDAERERDDTAVADAPADRVLGFVKADPVAAAHIVRQQLLHADALDALLEAGATQIPPFPSAALVVKPVFHVIRAADLAQGRYYALKTWPGPPPTPRPWGPSQWRRTAWIDVRDEGAGRGATDAIALADASSRTADTTYPLSSLLHFRLSAATAAALNAATPSAPPAVAGDIAVLVAMHVASREIARWTWQTFWWTPSPDDPGAPSSAAIAAQRPAKLRGAARHYALTLAYTMLSPDQPYVGGANAAPAVYAYNPWLEARLAPADLPDSRPGLAPDGLPAANDHGVQTNCMSCHAQANYNPRQRPTAPRPAGARYVDLGAAEFVGTLQVDFLWSIARHAR